ncbi:hypothetical protein Tsubulata_000899 [Turnera subulata]|uniref:DUF4283 domain-containing protein n=1 Tax=Turnera subulata TaxID=218843 RepID=A0A9Q0F305_9ROSI|nr:hypothetical protein Tsubulata_000899 [Turnera subulata]
MLHKRRSNTLIIKLWGRNIGFKSLCGKLPNLWKLKEGVQVVDLERNFYFVRFNNRQDYMHALTNGPWIVFGHSLTVEPSTLRATKSNLSWCGCRSLNYYMNTMIGAY